MAMMLSGVMMLRYLGEKDSAGKLEKAMAEVIAEGRNVTYDLKLDAQGKSAVRTSYVADAVIGRLKQSNRQIFNAYSYLSYSISVC